MSKSSAGRTGHHDGACGGGCRHCADLDEVLAGAPGGLTGWRLTLSAAAAFLGPLILAIVGAVIGSPSPVGQWVGAGVGLVIGLAAAVVVGRRLAAPRKEDP